MKKLSLISILLILISAAFVTFPAHATACVATYGVYGKVDMVLFPGGYATIDGTAVMFHYYTQDYLGNNRAVINGSTGTIEQTVAYYPYGGVIADLGTKPTSGQPYKFGGKELITANVVTASVALFLRSSSGTGSALGGRLQTALPFTMASLNFYSRVSLRRLPLIFFGSRSRIRALALAEGTATRA